jgi:hypothetical protein
MDVTGRQVVSVCPTFWENRWIMPKALSPSARHAQSEFGVDVGAAEGCGRATPAQIKAGIESARQAGRQIGGRRRGGHALTGEDVKKGGRVSAARRGQVANKPYERWIAAMVKMRQNGGSFQAIANWMTARGARAPRGARMGQKLVKRIIARHLGNARGR